MRGSAVGVMTPPKHKRPIGITLLAIAFLWIGVVGGLCFPIVARYGDLADVVQPYLGRLVVSGRGLQFAVWILSSAWFLLYVLYAYIGFGLWKLRNWARRGVIIVSALMPVMGVGFAISWRHDPWQALAGLFWCTTPAAWMVWYLMRPRVRYAFGAWPVNADNDLPPPLSSGKKALIGASVFATTLGVFLVCLLIGIEGVIHESDAYRAALRQVDASPCAASMLEAPIVPGWMTISGMETQGDHGSANLDIPVHGPKGKGNLSVIAEEREGVWKFDSVILSNKATQVNLTTPGSPCQP